MYIINSPSELIQLQDLPALSLENLRIVIKESLFSSDKIKKSCLDVLVKMMMNFSEYGQALKVTLCELMLRLCEDHGLQIIKSCEVSIEE